MTRWQFVREVAADLAPWLRSFGTRLVVFMMAGYLVGYAASGPRLALSTAGFGGLVVCLLEMPNVWVNGPKA